MMYPFIEVRDVTNRRFSICVDDISYVFESPKGCGHIVVRGSDSVIETRHSYTDVAAKLYDAYNPDERVDLTKMS